MFRMNNLLKKSIYYDIHYILLLGNIDDLQPMLDQNRIETLHNVEYIFREIKITFEKLMKT